MKHRLPVLLLLYFSNYQINAQVSIRVGANQPATQAISSLAPSHAVPYNYNDRSAHIQFVYTSAELNGGGAQGACYLDSIGWYVISQIGGPLQNYTIKIKNTSASNVATFDNSLMQTVYGPANLNPAVDSGWYMLKLSYPFYWDGTSNLLFDVCWGLNSSSSATGSIRHFSTSAGPDERIFIKSNSAAMCSVACNDPELFKPWISISATLFNGISSVNTSEISVKSTRETGVYYFSLPENFEIVPYNLFDAYGRQIDKGILRKENPVVNLLSKAKGIYFFSTEGTCIRLINQ